MESQEARVLDAFMMNARTLSSVLKAIQFRDVSKIIISIIMRLVNASCRQLHASLVLLG